MNHISEDLNTTLSNIYGFTIDENGKVNSPKMKLPVFVSERINFFSKYFEHGLTFAGALELILACDEEAAKEKFDFVAYDDWLPVSKEFEEWRDHYALNQQVIAIALIYGTGIEEEQS